MLLARAHNSVKRFRGYQAADRERPISRYTCRPFATGYHWIDHNTGGGGGASGGFSGLHTPPASSWTLVRKVFWRW